MSAHDIKGKTHRMLRFCQTGGHDKPFIVQRRCAIPGIGRRCRTSTVTDHGELFIMMIMNIKNPMLIGTIRSEQPGNSGGDIVIQTEMRDGEVYKKIFQRDLQSAPVRWISRQIDKLLGKENISAMLEGRDKSPSLNAVASLKLLEEGLRSVRGRLSGSEYSWALPQHNLPLNLMHTEDLPGSFSLNFKLDERFDSDEFIDALRANDSGFEESTLNWLKRCHQDSDRRFTYAEVSRVNKLHEEFVSRSRARTGGISDSQRLLGRELDRLNGRMYRRMVGSLRSEFADELKESLNRVSRSNSWQNKEFESLLNAVDAPDLPISLTPDDALSMGLGMLHADWNKIKSNKNLRRELAPLILGAEQAYFADKATTAALNKGVFKAQAMKFLADEIRRLAAEDKKNPDQPGEPKKMPS